MPVYAYDVPPHLYVRLAPQIGADLALVGPLHEGAYEQLLGEPQLLRGLQQSALSQVLLDLTYLPDLTSASLQWTLSSFAPSLASGGMRHLALVLPPARVAMGDELRTLAAQHLPELGVGCFATAVDATRWMASRQVGVGSEMTPEAIRSLAVSGKWLDAVAHYRALSAASLADALAVVEGLLQERQESPSSLVPSTEVPATQDPSPLVSEGALPQPVPSLQEPRSQPTSSSASIAQAATQASLNEQAHSASQLASAPTEVSELNEEPSPFKEDLPSAHELNDSLFPSGEAIPEEIFFGDRLREIESLLRAIFQRVWFVASEDGEHLSPQTTPEGLLLEVFEDSRQDAPLALGGAQLMRLLRSKVDLLRFSPDNPAEVTLRAHQLDYATKILSGILLEEHLDQLLENSNAKERCLRHRFLLLLERHHRVDRIVLTQDADGPKVLLFTLPDMLVSYLEKHRVSLNARNICVLSEQADSLFEKLQILPLKNIHINPDSASSTLLSREQLKQILQRTPAPAPAPSSTPAESAPTPVESAPTPAESAPTPVESAPTPAESAQPPAEIRRFHARSLIEAHFFLDLHGYERQERYQWKEERDGAVFWALLGKKPNGQQERFEFTIDTEQPLPQDGYFGPGPSPLLGPIELLQQATSLIQSANQPIENLSHEELTQAARTAEFACLLISEALRHYTQEDAFPEASLKTDQERQIFAYEPDRFSRSRVEEAARAYWYVASQLQSALQAPS